MVEIELCAKVALTDLLGLVLSYRAEFCEFFCYLLGVYE